MSMKSAPDNWLSLPTIATAAVEMADGAAGVQQEIATTEELLLAGTRFAPAQLDEAYQVVLDQEAVVYEFLHRVRDMQRQVHDSPYKQAMLKAIVDEGAATLDAITHLAKLVELLPERRRPPMYRPRRGGRP